MSEQIQTLTQNAVPAPAPHDFIARYGKWYDAFWMVVFLLATLIFLGLALIGSFGDYIPADHPALQFDLAQKVLREMPGSGTRFLFYFLALFMYGLYRLARGSVRAAGRASNWLLRASVDGLYIKYRSYLNHHFSPDDPVVLFIPHHLVDTVRGHIRFGWTMRIGSQNSNRRVEQGRKQEFIEIRLRKGADSQLVRDALLAERNRKSPGDDVVKSWSGHYPVRLVADDMLRIDMSGVRPGMAESLRALDRWFALETPQTTHESSREELSGAELDDKILDLVMEGETISASYLVRKAYGYNTTEAKNFIDEMRETGRANRTTRPGGDSQA